MAIKLFKRLGGRGVFEQNRSYRHVLSQMVLPASGSLYDNFSILYSYSKPSGKRLAFYCIVK